MEKKKQLKYAKIFALITLAVLLIVIIIPADKVESEYKIRREEKYFSGIKTTIEIILKQKEPTEKLEEISKHFREKHKTQNIFIFFYITDTQKHAYATANQTNNKFDGVKILQPVYGDLNWFIDSLKIPNSEIIGVWGDTLEFPYITGLIKQGGSTIIKSAFLEKRYMLKDEYLLLEKNNGMNLFRNKDNPDNHESYRITEDKKLEIYNRFFNLNNEITGGELQEVLPEMSY
jgi:hypothetical protein